jgi:hypothetical protein
MFKRLVIVLVILAALVTPAAFVFAHSQVVAGTTYSACEDDNGKVDAGTITQADGLNCNDGTHDTFINTVSWNVDGPQGIQGVQGDTGPKGDQGVQGTPGLQGDPGLKGDKGDTGPTGQNGTNGTNGAPGLIGPTGPDGSQGIQGIPGMSAWHIVVNDYPNAGPGGLFFARCPAGQNVLGGGVALGARNNGSYVSLSRPSALNGWAGSYGGNKTSLSVYAICSVVQQ